MARRRKLAAQRFLGATIIAHDGTVMTAAKT
jgi:hypothetical protein